MSSVAMKVLGYGFFGLPTSSSMIINEAAAARAARAGAAVAGASHDNGAADNNIDHAAFNLAIFLASGFRATMGYKIQGHAMIQQQRGTWSCEVCAGTVVDRFLETPNQASFSLYIGVSQN